MSTVVSPEPIGVARKRGPRPPSDTSASEPKFERVEFQAPIGWSREVDAAAESLGMKRSAYIRMAVALQMERDQARRDRRQQDD